MALKRRSIWLFVLVAGSGILGSAFTLADEPPRDQTPSASSPVLPAGDGGGPTNSSCDTATLGACAQRWATGKADCAASQSRDLAEVERSRAASHSTCAARCRSTRTERGTLACCDLGLGNMTCGAQGTSVDQIIASCNAEHDGDARTQAEQARTTGRQCFEMARIANRNCVAACSPPDRVAIARDLRDEGAKLFAGCAGFGSGKPLRLTVAIDPTGLIRLLSASQAPADDPNALCLTDVGRVPCSRCYGNQCVADYPSQCAASMMKGRAWSTVPFSGAPITVTFTINPL